MAYQSELQLENDVLQRLSEIGYERVNIHNKQTLEANFRQIINDRHRDKLDGKPLSDKEFERLMLDINGKSVFDSALILRDKYVLKRDDESIVYLDFLNKQKWCKNTFQVANQVNDRKDYRSRYDVTILINGLPLVQIELKRSGVAITEAFNQVKRYHKQSFTGLFRYIQLFVISNKMKTRYFANSDKELLKGFMFYWSDEANKRINHLKDFIDAFLSPCKLAKMISRYMIVNEADRILMALRPYQVYAVEALINQALETNNNGYIWHTTGSGKTLTSFKSSQVLAEEPDIKKVIFLVDRNDLDDQTLREFNKFQADSVDDTENTKKLLEQLANPSQKLLINTIQKISHAIKSGDDILKRYENDKVIFIIDECHRSQFGEMHRLIRKQFKNAQYFGFTGTPRFEENKSNDGRATSDIFGRCLHTYLIKDAIRDGNVLGFSIDYMNTLDVKDELDESETADKINTEEVWMADERLSQIMRHIVDHYDNKTVNRKYTSILAVQSIPMALKYYNLFSQAKAQGLHDLNVTTIFSLRPNEDVKEDDREATRDALERVMQDYNLIFDTNHSTENTDSYFKDVSKRMREVIPGQKIDILIVVNMFLTGFDSRKLNTLYVDKKLQFHELIQAYSRINRVEKETKPYGNIVCYRNLKARTDEAIEIFSQTDNTDLVLEPQYQDVLNEFKDLVDQLNLIAPTPESVDLLEGEEEQKDFVLTYRRMLGLLERLKMRDDYQARDLGISEQDIQDYKGKYQHIYDRVIKRRDSDAVSILEDIDFKIEMLHNDVINVQYILDLIQDINLRDIVERDEQRKQIHNMLKKAIDDQVRLKADLIREFIDEVVPQLEVGTDMNEAYLNFEEQAKVQEIHDFATDTDFSQRELTSLLDEYEFSGNINRNQVDSKLKGSFIKRRKKIDKITNFIKEVAIKYGLSG
ncbi:type I restriction endonuclease subunit R [Staphylococcus massiliensis]|uniref:Type I restriction enzyme endonuclease subunit n=1 Tax=Staphylococcus massiliensis S46 TaxID=1229783 RepID=K9B7X6_9STAP|nr:type I restriction endonuclease subunit R [Staphylococcus massiliensis]EKU49835.1 type I restriction-modification system, R subunit [Staphylococcus massiliensis S46]POA02074.1 type I restriction endonuclease subunit R [Staphylococcus massiliensis CCUG 55927]